MIAAYAGSSSPLVIVHSAIGRLAKDGDGLPARSTDEHAFNSVHKEGVAKDGRWCARLSSQIAPLKINTWTGFDAGEDEVEGLKKVLSEAHVVIVLVSAELLETGLCGQILAALREKRQRRAVTVRPILVRSCIYDGEPLLDEVPPINAQALESMREYEQERFLAEVARRITDNLRWAFRQEVNHLLGQRPTDVRAHLERIMVLLSQIGPRLEGVLCAVQDIGAYLLQEFLGNGSISAPWDDQPRRITDTIKYLTQVCRREPSIGEADSYDAICTIIRCLRALSSQRVRGAPDPQPRNPDVPLELLPLWLTADGGSSLTDTQWQLARAESLARLPEYFIYQYQNDISERIKQRPMPLVRILHSLWFCLLLLKTSEDEARKLEPQERNALAYVVREDLRFLCFGFEHNAEQRRPYYYFDSRRYTEALCTLLAYHAAQVLGSSFKAPLTDFLHQMARTSGVSYFPPVEHLQHVVSVYLAGNFLLDVRIAAPELLGAPTLGAVLRATGTQEALRECRQAFILACLFHDVGHLLMPHIAPDLADLAMSSSRLRFDLEAFCRNVYASVCQLVGGGVELLAEYVNQEERLSWLQAQVAHPGHSILGAQLLLRTLPELDRLEPWVVRSAVRAILLHNALDIVLDATEDPVAALLVLCDELFEWNPEQPAAQSAAGRALQTIAPEVPEHEPSDRLIRLHSISMRWGPERELAVWMTLDGQAARWPTIQIEFQGPQRLTLPIYELWLRKSRNLGRIRWAQSGFGPILLMTSPIAGSGRNSKTQLEALLQGSIAQQRMELLSTLDSWLTVVKYTIEGDQEKICLTSFDDDTHLRQDLPKVVDYLRLCHRISPNRDDSPLPHIDMLPLRSEN